MGDIAGPSKESCPPHLALSTLCERRGRTASAMTKLSQDQTCELSMW